MNFYNFIDTLRTPTNSLLIESIYDGYSILFEHIRNFQSDDNNLKRKYADEA